MIDKFNHGFLNRVYDLEDYTQLEINSKLIQKMDEVIEYCNSAFEFVDWIKEQGVPDEVQNILFAWKEDGTLKNLSIKKEIEQLSSQLSDRINQLNNETRNLIEEFKEEVNAELENIKKSNNAS